MWRLRGVVSNPRYTTPEELQQLTLVQPSLDRPDATCAALILIQKADGWWAMGQDKRRAIFEESSKYISRSIKYMPAVARRLHHSRDLGEPLDFLTWFEFAPRDAVLFDTLVHELRDTEEGRYVIREVDIRLTR